MTPTTLKTALNQRGLSIRGAAPVLGVHWCTVRDYLSGRRNISHDRAELIRLRLAEYDSDPWIGRDRAMAQTQSKRKGAR